MKKLIKKLDDLFISLVLAVFYFVFIGLGKFFWFVLRKKRDEVDGWVEKDKGDDELCMF